MNYTEVTEYLNNIPRFMPEDVMTGKCPYDLEAMTDLLKRAGNPEKNLRFVHITGTNGKGSTVAFLDSILSHGNIRCGSFRTPQLMEYTETISLMGKEISKEDFAVAMTKVIEICNAMKTDGLRIPSEFELLFCAALIYFKETEAEIVLVEAGLGGRRDATNVIPTPIITIFSPIGIDHIGILGNTLSEIAREKSGIIKRGTLVVSASQPPEAEIQLREAAIENSSEFLTAPSPGHIFYNESKMTQSFRIMRNSALEEALHINDVEARNKYRMKAYHDTIFANENDIDVSSMGIKRYDEMVKKWDEKRKLAQTVFASVFDISMLGTNQAENATVALTSAAALNNFGYEISLEDIKYGLLNAKLPAHFEILLHKPLFICDVTHNISGVRTLEKNVRDYFEGKKIHYIVGVLRDKKHRDMLGILIDDNSDFRTVPVDSARALQSDELCRDILEMGGTAVSFTSVKEAVKDALSKCRDDEAIVSFGSLGNAGEIREVVLSQVTE